MHMALIRKVQDRPWMAKKQRLKILGLVIFEESFSKKHEQALYTKMLRHWGDEEEKNYERCRFLIKCKMFLWECIISSSDKEVGVVIKSEVYLIWVFWVIYAHFTEVSFELCCIQ